VFSVDGTRGLARSSAQDSRRSKRSQLMNTTEDRVLEPLCLCVSAGHRATSATQIYICIGIALVGGVQWHRYLTVPTYQGNCQCYAAKSIPSSSNPLMHPLCGGHQPTTNGYRMVGMTIPVSSVVSRTKYRKEIQSLVQFRKAEPNVGVQSHGTIPPHPMPSTGGPVTTYMCINAP
jgi:hypothetical protein